jgi:hypothetical protein
MLIAFVGLLIVVAFFMFNRSVFRLRFNNGKLEGQSGQVPAVFLNDVKDIATRSSLTGTIKAVKSRGSERLCFDQTIPENIQQRIRNIFPYSNPNGPTRSNKRKG